MCWNGNFLDMCVRSTINRARARPYIFWIIRHDRRTDVGQIETAIIRHWLPRRGSGVFLIPRRSGGGKLDVKRTRRGWFAPRIHALHQYIAHHRSDNRSVTAFFSRDRPLQRDMFPSHFKGHDTMIDRRLALRSRILSIILVVCDVPLNYRWKNKNKK